MRTITSLARDANPGCVRIDLKLTIGGTGAVTAFRGMWLKDSAPPVRASAGQYTITLDRPVRDLVGFGGSMLQQGTEILEPVILTDASSTTGIITIQTRNGSGAATDPTSGDVIYLGLTLDVDGLQF